ncbi:MAG: hypothetical protein J6V09_05475 [Clostridia bacterium]|nr:hypothetical protein [Clostridia bacterium]
MFHTVITRKNLINLSLSVFYSLLLAFVGLCLDAETTFVNKNNPIAALGSLFGFSAIDAGTSAFICLLLVAFYISVMVLALSYEKRYAIVNGHKPYSFKMISVYTATVILCVALSYGLGLLIHAPIAAAEVALISRFIWQAILLTTIIYTVLFVAIGSVVMLVFNLILVDKPYKFFKDAENPVIGDEIEASADLNGSFDMGSPQGDFFASEGSAAASVNSEGGEVVISGAEQLDDREKVFPALSKIDVEYEGFINEVIESSDITLEELCDGFRKYLAREHKLYFDIDVIRFFVSGFAASHFEILEGLSGTGKSSLPRYFAKYVNADVLFMPVQATWRDKTNIIGFFNEFSKTYNESEFLEKLYLAAYNPDRLQFFVLDEMNISRVEYYFADLLSVLEYPKDEWKIKLMQMPHSFVPPMQLEDGFIKIPDSSYFVGTANKDDSTFTITDKVYDRAITIDFTENNRAFEVKEETPTVTVSNTAFKAMMDEARGDVDLALTDSDREKMSKIFDYVNDKFDIAVGNRILNQIENVVPVFCKAGGDKEVAIDFMLSKKLVAKIEGRFEEHVKDSLLGLLSLLERVYGASVMKRTEKVIKTIIKSL